MKRKTVLGITAVLILVFLSSANAALHDRGNGLIYDDSLNITWLQNANYAEVTMTWDDANIWAGDLVFQGYEDWRLPVFDCVDNTCTDGEMGHLFAVDGISSGSPGIYLDVRPSIYWSGTENTDDTSTAYRFNFKYGSDGLSDKTQKRYAWAVRDGDSSFPVAPEPVSSLLFLAGGATFGIKRFIKKQP